LPYGQQALAEENLAGAGSLFALANSFWTTPETKGKLGAVWLLLEQTEPGKQLLREAQQERGLATALEPFCEGLHFPGMTGRGKR
jgi:hypothetical protein